MTPKKPIAYFFSLGGIVLPQAAKKLLESQSWWSDVPFGWLSIISLAFGLGLAVEDLFNSRSWIRGLLRDWTRKFEVVQADAVFLETPFEHIAIRCRIKFLADLKQPTLKIRVREHLYTETRTKVIHSETLPDQVKDSEMRLRLGAIPVSGPGWTPRYAIWGPHLNDGIHKDTEQHIASDVRNTVEIVIGKQIVRVYVHPRGNQQANSLPYVMREEEVPTAHL